MTPEDEAPARPPQQQRRQQEKRRGRDSRGERGAPSTAASEPSAAREESGESQRDDRAGEASDYAGTPVNDAASEETPSDADASASIEIPPPRNLLLEELAGREIGSRLRARYAEIIGRIQALDVDGSVKDAWFKRAEVIDPELWMTPEEVLDGVRNNDAQYDKLRAGLAGP